MASVSEMMSKTKDQLARGLARAQSALENTEEENNRLLSAANECAATLVTGPGSAFAVGFIEDRFRLKDGSRISLGPIPLSVLTGTAVLAPSFFVPWEGLATHLRIVSASHFGLAAGTYGRGWGALRREEVLKKKAGGGGGTAAVTEGEEDWSAEEWELLQAA